MKKLTKFAILCNSDDLSTMITEKIFNINRIAIHSDLILEVDDNLSIVHTIAISEGQLYYFNYNQKFKPDFRSIPLKEIKFFSVIGKPNRPDPMVQYNKFVRDYNKTLKEFDSTLYSMYDRGLLNYHIRLDMSLFDDTRKKFKLLKNEEPNFIEKWKSGDYHLSTLLEKLTKVNTVESKLLYEFIPKQNLKIKNYGLTDIEILIGLRHSKHRLEGILYRAYINNSRNIILMISLASKFSKLSGPMRKKASDALRNMAKEKRYTKDMLKKDLS